MTEFDKARAASRATPAPVSISYVDLIFFFIVSLFKVVFFSFPNLRKPAGIQNALNGPASATHPLGIAIDAIKMTWVSAPPGGFSGHPPTLTPPHPRPQAARLFAVYTYGVALPVGALLQGLVQLYCTACVRLNPTLCASQLMRDPVMVGRLRQGIALTSVAVLPSAVASAQLPPGAECSFAYSLLALVVGVVLSTLPVVVREMGPCRGGNDSEPGGLA